MDDIVPQNQYIKLLYSPSTKTSTIRTWNGSEHNSIRWDFTGSSMKIYIQRKAILIHCPIISMSPEDKDTLPYNPCAFSPSSERFIDEYDSTVFPLAKICLRDPYTMPLAMPLAMPSAMPSAMPLAMPIPMKLPPHITRLVLADSINKNECCPITCDTITRDNASITSCGHVFTTNAIKHWLSLSSSRNECPVCKQACSV